MEKELEKIVPQVHDHNGFVYVEMFVEAKRCKCCNKIMLKRDLQHIYPIWNQLSQDAQMKRVGFVYQTSVLVDNEPICNECVDSGKSTFICALCLERKSTDKIQESIGDPAEFLCAKCYNTVPASEWDNKVSELHKEHYYDFNY